MMKDKRRFRLLLLGGALAIVTALGVASKNAFHRAWLREAYLPELQQYVQATPSDGVAQGVLGIRHIEAHQFDQATVALKSAALAGENDPSLWLCWAASDAARGNTSGALSILSLGKRDPRLASALSAAIDRSKQVRPDSSPIEWAEAINPQGIKTLQQILLPPNLFSTWFAWQGERQPEKSGFTTRAAWFEQTPKDSRRALLWAQALTKNQRYPDAEPILLRLLQEQPENLPAALTLADLRLKAGVPARAGRIYKALLSKNSELFEAVIGLGHVATTLKLVYLGVEMGEKATKLQPNNADAWLIMGDAYFNQKLHWDFACNAYEKSIKLNPDNLHKVFDKYYDSLRATGKFPEGEAILRKHLSSYPDDPKACYLLAMCLLERPSTQETINEAEKLLRKSTALEINVAAPAVRLGQLLLERGAERDLHEATLWFAKAMDIDPYQDQAVSLLARTYHRLGMKKDAKLAEDDAKTINAYTRERGRLEDLENREPMNLAVHEKLAKLYREGGEEEKAAKSAQMAYMLKNHKKEAEQGIASLIAETNLSSATEWQKKSPKKEAEIQNK